MSKPQRIQLKRAKGWRKPEEAIVVSRPGKWGNPFRVRFDGEHWRVWTYRWAGKSVPWDTQEKARERAVERFRIWLEDHPDGQQLAAAAREELRGKDLCCWCPLDKPCHADVLLEVANG